MVTSSRRRAEVNPAEFEMLSQYENRLYLDESQVERMLGLKR
jgi:hypothetical protein